MSRLGLAAAPFGHPHRRQQRHRGSRWLPSSHSARPGQHVPPVDGGLRRASSGGVVSWVMTLSIHWSDIKCAFRVTGMAYQVAHSAGGDRPDGTNVAFQRRQVHRVGDRAMNPAIDSYHLISAEAADLRGQNVGSIELPGAGRLYRFWATTRERIAAPTKPATDRLARFRRFPSCRNLGPEDRLPPPGRGTHQEIPTMMAEAVAG